MRVELYYMIIFLLAATNLIAEELNIYAISKPNEAVKLIGPDANLQMRNPPNRINPTESIPINCNNSPANLPVILRPTRELFSAINQTILVSS